MLPSKNERSARSARPAGRSRKQCKPDAKRKRDSAQPQERAQPSRKAGEAMKLRLAFFLLLIAGAIYGQQVPFERILNANKEPQNWLTYGGTLFNQRYSLLS